MAIPATGALQRHARIHQRKGPPQTVAIEEEPFDSVISETTAIVYGKSSLDGSIGRNARHASLPWPISRRPEDQYDQLHQQSREGSCSAAGRCPRYSPWPDRSMICSSWPVPSVQTPGLSFTTGEQAQSRESAAARRLPNRSGERSSVSRPSMRLPVSRMTHERCPFELFEQPPRRVHVGVSAADGFAWLSPAATAS